MKNQEIAIAFGTSLFERKSYMSEKIDAQLNLAGKTHYVDDSTLKAFHSRITKTAVCDNGLIFALVESVAADHENKSRGFRFVAFDLSGQVINDRIKFDSLFPTTKQATKAMWDFLNSFDAAVHYRELLTRHAKRARETAAKMESLASQI